MTAVLAFVWAALIVDIAVETFVSGSPVRVVVGAVAGSYLGIAAALRLSAVSGQRRWQWAWQPSASLIVVLGLISLSTWLPGGLTDGVVVLGQPTAIVLSAVTIAAIALGGFVLLRLPSLPWWARGVLSLLAIYGIGSFGYGMVLGISYPGLLQGDGQPQLPFWIQGAFAGALIVIPVAIIGALLSTLSQLQSPESKPTRFRQAIALALSLLMAVSGASSKIVPTGGVIARGSDLRQPAADDITRPLASEYRRLAAALAGDQSPPLSETEMVKGLGMLFDTARDILPLLPRTTFDAAAIVNEVGRDPVRLFEWVRDNTDLVPYAGLLRGPSGVLQDRLGNSLDRALLLHHLLSNAGFTARLATGRLAAAQADALLSRSRGTVFDGRGLSQTLESAEGEGDPVRGALRALSAEQQRVRDKAHRRIVEQTVVLTDAVLSPPFDELQERRRRAAILEEHWWVEWLSGTTWTALDVTQADATPGLTLAETTSSLPIQRLQDVGGERMHSLQLRVVAEVWQDGRLTEVPVLVHEVLPAELAGKHLVLRFDPLAWPRDTNLLTQQEPIAAFRQLALGQREWLPVVESDGRRIGKVSFNDRGELRDTTQPALAPAAEGLGRSIGGLLAGSRRSASADSQPQRTVTAVWIDYALSRPGAASRTIRREIFDLVGPAKRAAGEVQEPPIQESDRLTRSLALLGETQILPMVGNLSEDFVRYLAVANFVTNRDAVVRVYGAASTRDLNELNQGALQLHAIPFSLYNLALARRAWSPVRNDVYIDDLNILSSYKRPCLNALQQLRMCEGLDIVANEVAVRLKPGIEPFRVRLAQGVTDTNAEALVVLGARTVQNTAEIAARTAPTEWMTIRRMSDVDVLVMSDDARERMKRTVEDGQLVVVPKRAVSIDGREAVGWWRVDPETGSVLGIGPQGRGQASMEMAFTVAYVTGWVVGVISFISCVGLDGTFSNTKGIMCFACAIVDGVAIGAVVQTLLLAPPGYLILSAATRTEMARAAAVTVGCTAIGAFVS